MGYLRFRRSIRIAPGIRLNVGKRGISTSVGVRGFHETVHISGARRTSIGIPGTGLSYIAQTSGSSRHRSSAARRSAGQSAAAWSAPGFPGPNLDPATVLPRPGLFASSAEKHYHAGLIAYLHGDLGSGPAALRADLRPRIHGPRVPSSSPASVPSRPAIEIGRSTISKRSSRRRLPCPMPSPPGTCPRISSRPRSRSGSRLSSPRTCPWNRAGAVLALAELYQSADRLEEAVGLVQQLHAAEPDDPVVRLSLADLLGAEGDFEGVVEVAAGVENTDDVTLATVHLRAKALLELDHRIAGFETYRLALARTAGRSPELLKAIRYDRALAYQADRPVDKGRRPTSRDCSLSIRITAT